MTPEETAKQPVTLIITRTCKSKLKLDSPLQEFEVGQEATFVRAIGDELVSINKAVVKGSPQHEQWVESRKNLKAPVHPLQKKIDALQEKHDALQEEHDATLEENAELKKKLERKEK